MGAPSWLEISHAHIPAAGDSRMIGSELNVGVGE